MIDDHEFKVERDERDSSKIKKKLGYALCSLCSYEGRTDGSQSMLDERLKTVFELTRRI